MSALERELAALASAVDVPETPDLVPRVLAEVVARPPRRRAGWSRRWALAVALLATAALAAALAIPDARSTLLRVLHLGGERIVRVDELPSVDAGPGLFLGEEVTLAEARERAAFGVRTLGGEPPPDRAFLGARGTVWLLWGTTERVRLLLAQTPELAVGTPPLFEKLVSMGTEVELVSVSGRPAWFLSGSPHVVYHLDAGGGVVEETVRLAENVLVWEQDGVTFRIEGDLDADRAVELASSVR